MANLYLNQIVSQRLPPKHFLRVNYADVLKKSAARMNNRPSVFAQKRSSTAEDMLAEVLNAGGAPQLS